jgi:subtilisin family serine protease
MTREERYKIISEDYVDLIIKYNGNPISLEQFKDYSVHIMNDTYAVIYLPISMVTSKIITEFNYSALPHCYALTSAQSLEASGVTRLNRSTALQLRGKGVLIGMIDTGIDYTHPVFRYEDGSTKIMAIWDQTIDSEDQYPKLSYPVFYGTEFTAEQINQALQSDNPFQLVPTNDEIGHGTMLAGIAAGSESESANFSGVVPDADFLVVKLKRAKKFFYDIYFIPEIAVAYQENDIIWALEYLIEIARNLKRPIAICIGLGSSMGPNDGSGPLNTTLSVGADFPGITAIVSAGNEGNSRRHFYSQIRQQEDYVAVELNVGGNEEGFMMEVWGTPPMIYTLDILSPNGEYISRIQENLVRNQEVTFIFEQTVIYIDYIMIETDTGKQVIVLRFQNPTQGLWRFQVYGRGDLPGEIHIWLPPADFISRDTYFINATSNNTITSPGDSVVPITVTAYNPITNNIYPEASRGYTVSGAIKPELAAPGVNILCPDLKHGFTTITGTGAAAAHAAGISAMLLEWSSVQGNFPRLDTVGIKKFLIRGARRSGNLTYPNRDWGYGMIDIYNAFNILRSDIVAR